MANKEENCPINLFIGKAGAEPFAIALDQVTAYEWEYRVNPTKIMVRFPGSTGMTLDKDNGEKFCKAFLEFKAWQARGM